MKDGFTNPGGEAIAEFGWWHAHRFLVLRRITQLGILTLFLAGPWFGWWIVKGNLASSLTLGVLPLSDPLVMLQVLATGHWPETAALIGAVVVLGFYLLAGGRVYCSWVCPINMVTDLAEWLRRRLHLKGSANISSRTRYWLLAAILLVAAVSGSVAWELVNPVSMVYRGLVFGMGMAWGIVLAVFLLDLLIARRAWCGRLCPVGAFYGLLGEASVLRVSAVRREQCDDCMDCYAVCPEHQVIRPALKGNDHALESPVITSGNCTNCGRCIDVCARNVFEFTHRFNSRLDVPGANPKREVSS